MKTRGAQMIALWDVMMKGQKTFIYRDIVEVYVCCRKGLKKAKILETTEKGVLVKMPRLQKGQVYGVKIITSRGWNGFRYLCYQ